ncbi:hypothetical protein UFOVP610_48 [uncultured Caudovirales phage]|uniref:Uncharacterized protein n=1 Tax=uncultured Caudovirales phage TaxID=2100421 RepID=A0A6J5N435_9CAUD|nr:hypothetical protein UFOVP610_48 [uncultured Caudovirales phage]
MRRMTEKEFGISLLKIIDEHYKPRTIKLMEDTMAKKATKKAAKKAAKKTTKK